MHLSNRIPGLDCSMGPSLAAAMSLKGKLQSVTKEYGSRIKQIEALFFLFSYSVKKRNCASALWASIPSPVNRRQYRQLSPAQDCSSVGKDRQLWSSTCHRPFHISYLCTNMTKHPAEAAYGGNMCLGPFPRGFQLYIVQNTWRNNSTHGRRSMRHWAFTW